MRWISLGVLVAAGVVLALFWGDVPDRWATHWGLHGQPDHWVTKRALVATAPLLIGLLAWVVVESFWFAFRRDRGNPHTPVPPEMEALQTTAVRMVVLGIAVLMAGLALALPFLRPRSPLPIVVAAVVDLGVFTGIAMVWTARQTRRLRERGVAIPEGYTGVLYNNPRDARVWVPKIGGVGSTLNFAHRRAWLLMFVMACAPLVILMLYGLLAYLGR